jgi:hypothetical protein
MSDAINTKAPIDNTDSKATLGAAFDKLISKGNVACGVAEMMAGTDWTQDHNNRLFDVTVLNMQTMQEFENAAYSVRESMDRVINDQAEQIAVLTKKTGTGD